MCVYLYIHNKYTKYTHTYVHTFFILNAINQCPGLLLLLLVMSINHENV